MWISKRGLTIALATGIAALSTALATGAFGDSGGGKGEHHKRSHGKPLIDASLAPSLPTDPTFHGVGPGGAPWVLKRGRVQVRSDGGLKLRVRGLVIPDPPGDGTPGPVETVSASLYCGADSETAAADTSKAVPISRRGNARIRDKSFDAPATCLAPVILVHPNGNTTLYIAVDGRRD
jgi:hypothetical protein